MYKVLECQISDICLVNIQKDDAELLMSEEPLFSYFLDGSRYTYKVDDIAYKNQVYPIVAGQVGISCCTRVNGEMRSFKFERRLAIALPKAVNKDDWKSSTYFPNLKKKINEQGYRLKENSIQFTDIIPYSTKKDEFERIENKAIAVIQDLMIKQEVKMVSEMVEQHVHVINATLICLKMARLNIKSMR